MPDKLHIYVALIAYRGVDWRTYQCLARDLGAWTLNERIHVLHQRFGEDALISRSRSMACQVFLDSTESDVMVWIDADTTWQGPAHTYEGDVVRIARKAHETGGIVGGAVPKRGFGMGIASGGGISFETGTDQLIETCYVGAAFQAIARPALMAIGEKLPWCAGFAGTQRFKPYCIPITIPAQKEELRERGLHEYLSEDYALTWRAREADVPVHLDAKPVLGHVGDHVFTVTDAFRGHDAV